MSIPEYMLAALAMDPEQDAAPGGLALDGMQLGPVLEILSDPLGAVEDTVNVLDGRARATGWLGRAARARRGLNSNSASSFRQRPCCMDMISRFDGRPDLVYPVPIECPTCGAKYQIALRLSGRR